jgi:hypothetical protein
MIRATDLKVCLSEHLTQYSVSGKNSSRAAGIVLPQSKHLPMMSDLHVGGAELCVVVICFDSLFLRVPDEKIIDQVRGMDEILNLI